MAISLYRYKVEDAPFASGGMGAVYRAVDRLSGETVVIKIINTHKLNINEKIIRTFFKEAEASFRLGRLSDHIVKVTDIGYELGVHYMAQEYASGGNLNSRLGKVNSEEAKVIIDNVLRGLKVAHENKIIHSDISPENILFDEKACIYKLSDFGLLKIMESHLITKGPSLLHGGKLDYMPPIHVYNPEQISAKTDFYAIGMIYYQLLTGKTLRPNLPDPPTITPPVVINATRVNLDKTGVKFIDDCFYGRFETVNQVITAFAGITPVTDTQVPSKTPRPISTPRFEVSMLGINEYDFMLLTADGELVFRGQTYRSKSHAKSVINSVKKSALLRERYSRKHAVQEHFFVLNSAKSEPLGQSRPFANIVEMEEKIEWMMINAPLAKITYSAKTKIMT